MFQNQDWAPWHLHHQSGWFHGIEKGAWICPGEEKGMKEGEQGLGGCVCETQQLALLCVFLFSCVKVKYHTKCTSHFKITEGSLVRGQCNTLMKLEWKDIFILGQGYLKSTHPDDLRKVPNASEDPCVPSVTV